MTFQLKINMKKILLLVVMFLAGFATLQAQSAKRLHFIYIDHESDTPVNRLCNKLKDLRDKAIEDGTGLIVYLANNYNPMISVTNIDTVDKKYVGDEIFDDIIAALQEENSHDVNAKTDLEQILKIMDECQLNDAQMKLGYRRVTFDFYAGATFWGLRNNERLISYLYFALEIPHLQEEELYFNIYKPKGAQLVHLENKPFGDKNVEDVNKLRILDF